ncbi:MAG: exo-alpha-sialidase [Planctomycetes bacterium]|nr:exo-alpha-sialidase [Planctomycetota bacterium]
MQPSGTRSLMKIAGLAPILILSCVACTAQHEPSPLESVLPLDTPAGEKTSGPSLTTGDGRLLLSWMDASRGEGGELRYAAFDGANWGPVATVARSPRMFVNWADVPSLAALGDGSVAAHWLERAGRDGFAYGIRLSTSSDGRADWSPAQRPHDPPADRSEHGFVSLVPEEDGALGVIWLDGREMPRGGTMQLIYRRWHAGEFGEEQVLDGDVCTCCPTSALRVAGRTHVVYRGHDGDEIRDIRTVSGDDGAWSEPRPVQADGWRIPACPVNGPALASNGERLAVAWFTAADERPRVQLKGLSDGAWDEAIRVDGGDPLGRVALTIDDEGRALVAWLESVEGGAEVRLRPIGPDGTLGEAVVVAGVEASRVSGMLQLARLGERVFLAWTARGPSVRLAEIVL